MSRKIRSDEFIPKFKCCAKRVCNDAEKAQPVSNAKKHFSENNMWPNKDDSFLSCVTLEEVFSDQDNVVPTPFSSQYSNNSGSDSSLFSDTIPPPKYDTDVEGKDAPVRTIPDEEFTEYNLKIINKPEHLNIFNDDASELELQNSHIFLRGMPKMNCSLSASPSISFLSTSILDGIVHGTQQKMFDLECQPAKQGYNIFPTSKIMGETKVVKTMPNEMFTTSFEVDELKKAENVDIFNDSSEVELQNSQMFLKAMPTLKSAELMYSNSQKKRSLSAHLSSSWLSNSIMDNIVHGTQYQERGTLKSQHILQSQHESDAEILNQLDWQTQALEEFNRNDQSFPAKGSFYGLPCKVKDLIFEHKGINNLYDWQDECLNLPAIRKRKNLIYALPTSGGKTLVAEILMLRELLCRNRNVLFILPYVSIVQEKVSAMSPFAIAMDFIVDEYTAGKGKCPPPAQRRRRRLFIASIEKGAVLMDSLIEVERPHEIGLIVVDELHLIGERGRGSTLEALLTKVMFLHANIQIVGMSATIGNLKEISAFLNADVYTRGFRPVELKEYIKCGSDLLEINASGQTLDEIFVLKRSVSFNYSPAVRRADPDHLAGLISECAPEHCCLVFCPTRKNCENVALLLCSIVPKHKFFNHRQTEKAHLMKALNEMCGTLSPVLAKTLPYGIAYHHSGLTTDERKYIETAYRFGVVTVICCTSTLAAGVNLPAKRVIIRAPYVGQEFITLCKYKQMIGRAGRAGLGKAGESILITQSKDNLRVGEMLFSPMEKALSSLDQLDGIGLQSLITSAIGLNLVDCRHDLNRLVNSTLLAVQAIELKIVVEDLVIRILRDLFTNKVLQVCENHQNEMKPNSTDIATSQDDSETTQYTGKDGRGRRLLISRFTRFKLTSIGYAAFKAGIDYKRAFVIQKELKDAQKQLILSSYVHLIYLVICFNSNDRGDELFPADAAILFREYNTLSSDTLALFTLLGFTEAHAARLAKTQSIQGSLTLQMNRLYKMLILSDILSLIPLPNVASKYNIERGTLQQLINQSTAAAGAIVRLCEQIDEFWCYKPLFERINHKMDRCGSLELEPLLELPSVKINRAKQLYAKGFRTIEDVAKTRPRALARSVEFMPLKVATEIISAAKILLMKKLDHLEEATEAIKSCLFESKISEKRGNKDI